MERELGPRIRQYIKSKGISQAYLADKTEVSDSQMSAALNGRQKLSAELYLSICNILEVPVSYFYSESDEQ